MQSSRTPSARRRFPAPGRCEIEASRLAFTLLELLIAIAIIGILASLILTVAGSASMRAHEAQVSADILTLSTGIAAFKQRYSVEPPSSITLYEQGTGVAAAGTGWAADPRSMGLIRLIWPQFDFAYTAEGGVIDINGNGTTNDTITLSGAECLVFFLGGMPTLQGTGPGGIHTPSGFSQNSVDPFNRSGSNRISFTEFDASRLYQFQSGSTAHTMNTYCDTLAHPSQPTSSANPYLYLSSYGGQGYNIAELVGTPANAGNAPGGESPTTSNAFIDVYRQGNQGYWPVTSTSQPESWQTVGSTTNSNTPSPPWNTNSYQIISPGGDQLYGIGGEYEAANGSTLLVIYAGATPAQNVDRTGERDNITNFSSGRLAP